MQNCSGYLERQVREVTHDIAINLNEASKLKKFNSIYAKYGTAKFGRVASIPKRNIE